MASERLTPRHIGRSVFGKNSRRVGIIEDVDDGWPLVRWEGASFSGIVDPDTIGLLGTARGQYDPKGDGTRRI